MNKVDRQKIKENLVTLEKWLILKDDFQRMSVQKTIFTQRLIDDTMKNESPGLAYCLRLVCRFPNALVNLLRNYSKQNKMILHICLKITQSFSYFSLFSSEPISDRNKRLVTAENINFIYL